jgi:tetratricopeptide (TPR) repeat protein
MMKMISVIKWNFGRASGDAEMVDNPSKAQQGDSGSDAGHAKPTESSSKVATEGVPPQKAGIDQMVLLLKKNGMEKYDNEEYQAALADFDAACKLEPQCVFSLKYRGDIKYMLCQYEEALKDLTLASETEPNDWFTLSRRGAVYKALDDYENALEDLNRADELDANNHFIKTERGVVKRSLRDFAGALVDLSHAANACSPHQAYILMQLGVVKRELGQFHEALGYLNRAYELKSTDTFMELESNDAFLHRQRGVVRREVKDLEGALHDLNIAHRIVSDDAYTLRRRGITRRELLDCQGSLEDLNEANYLEPFNNLTLNERGVTKKVLGDFQGAIEDLTMANHIKADQAFTLKHRGSAYRELGNLVDALEDLSYANSLEPNVFFTLLELGMAKNVSHDYEAALTNYNKVLEIEPNDPWILRQRGTLRRKLEDHDGALEDLDKANIMSSERPELFSNRAATIMERCFTKYAKKDVGGALADARKVRNLWGEHGQSLIMGEKLKHATIKTTGSSSEQASSISQRQLDNSRHVLWMDPERLVILKNLGKGSFGHVQKCRWMDKNRDVAVKFVFSQIQDTFEKEVEILARIQHPRVVRLIGCSYDKKEKQGMLVMELMECNLRSLINAKKCGSSSPFDVSVAVNMMIQIAEAMEYLHEQGVLHRDLKSSNILVNSDTGCPERYTVKIADFGLSKLQAQNNMPYFMTLDVGATPWRAPEVFRIPPYQKYSFPADVWSYGMTCFEILSGEEPFEDVPRAQIRSKVLEGLRPALPASCPGVLKLLLKKCWAFSPGDRPTFPEIRKILKLYLGVGTSEDICVLKAGDAIRPHEISKQPFDTF